jgi:TPR repeat protein
MPKDAEKAAEFFKKACDAKDARGCGNLGTMYLAGKDGFPKDVKHANDLFAIACDGDYATACGMLSDSYCDGVGVAASQEKCVQVAEKACTMGDGAECRNLGVWTYRSLYGLKRNDAKTKAYLEMACNDVAVQGCGVYAEMHFNGVGMPVDRKAGFELAQRGCVSDEYESCYYLAKAYKYGWGTPVSTADYATALRKACDLGNDLACQDLKR